MGNAILGPERRGPSFCGKRPTKSTRVTFSRIAVPADRQLRSSGKRPRRGRSNPGSVRRLVLIWKELGRRVVTTAMPDDRPSTCVASSLQSRSGSLEWSLAAWLFRPANPAAAQTGDQQDGSPSSPAVAEGEMAG